MSEGTEQPTLYRVVRKVEYDHQRLDPGELVERVGEWRKAPEGHYITKFKMTNGESIPLMMDEVVPAEPGEEEKIELETADDLFAFLRRLPEQERWEALKVINRLQKRQIDHVQAAAEIKSLFLKSGVAHE